MRLIQAEDVLRGAERLLNEEGRAAAASPDGRLPQFITL
jgi:hypothetical protein